LGRDNNQESGQQQQQPKGVFVWSWIKTKAGAANLADWIQAACAVAIAAATITYVCYARRQWRTMEGTLNQLIEQVDIQVGMNRPSLEPVTPMDEKRKPYPLQGNELKVDQNGGGTINFPPIRWTNEGDLPVFAPTAELRAFITSDARPQIVGPKIEEKLNDLCSAEHVTKPISEKGKIYRKGTQLTYPPSDVGLLNITLEKIDTDPIKSPGPAFVWMTACIRYPLVPNGKMDGLQEYIWRLYLYVPGKGNKYDFPIPRRPSSTDPQHPDNLNMELTEYGKYQ